MKSPILFRQVLPLVLLYLLMIFSVIVIDYILHRFQVVWVGRHLGLAGTLLITSSFVYSMRKRNVIKTGSPKKLLLLHEYLTWIGAVLLLVHAGIHFNAILPWLAVYMLLINVASGFVGKYLLRNAKVTLEESKRGLIGTGMSEEDAGRKLFLDSVTVAAMQHWRVIHLPISFLFALLAIFHIITVLMFGK